MKTKVLKSLLLAAAAIVLVVASVLGTMAYLTSYATISNTFTVGNVGIQLYESKVNDAGVGLDDNPNVHGDMKDAQGNTYHLIPGTTYTKDPTVYINADSDASYVFVYLQNGLEAVEQGHFKHTDGMTDIITGNEQPTIHDQMVKNGWALYKEGLYGDIYVFAAKLDETDRTVIRDAAGNAIIEYTEDNTTGEIVRKPVAQAVPKVDGVVKLDVFHTFTVDGHANLSGYATAEINITAYAVQSNTFENVDSAWAAIVQAYPKQAPVMDAFG